MSCYELQSKTIDNFVRDKLINLTNYIKELPPKITAFGFFDVNQAIFSSIISTLVAYIVIILQFGGK